MLQLSLVVNLVNLSDKFVRCVKPEIKCLVKPNELRCSSTAGPKLKRRTSRLKAGWPEVSRSGSGSGCVSVWERRPRDWTEGGKVRFCWFCWFCSGFLIGQLAFLRRWRRLTTHCSNILCKVEAGFLFSLLIKKNHQRRQRNKMTQK